LLAKPIVGGFELRVLFIVFRDFKNPSSVGGDYYLWELARGLSQLGYEVTLLCSDFEGSKQSEIIDGVSIVRLTGTWILPLRIFNKYFKRMKGNFDIIVEEVIGGQRLPFLCTVYVKEPLVAVWHQRHYRIFREEYPPPLAIPLALLELFQARLYRNRTIVTPSKGAKKQLEVLGFKSNAINVVYDGVGEEFCIARPRGLPSIERENLIVWLGKLRKYKRPDHVIMALPEILRNTKQTCTLIIAGKISEIDFDYVDSLRNLAKRLGVEDHVRFRLNISESEKMELLTKARVLVQPSPVEGFSVVVIEANNCGTPVVASSGVPKDVIIENFNGLVYPFGDIEALSKALAELLNNNQLWKRLSQNSFSWAQNFTWEKSVNTFNVIIRKLLSLEADKSVKEA